MSRLVQSTASKVAIGLTVAVGVVVFAGWRVFQPKIRTATIMEIEAALPKQVLAQMPEDKGAQARLTELVKLLVPVNTKSADAMMPTNVSGKKNSFDNMVEASKRFWQANPHLIDQLETTLNAGPIQCKKSMSDFSMFSRLKSIAKILNRSAVIAANDHEFNTATRLLTISIKLGDRVMQAEGPLINYLVAASIQAVNDKGIKETIDSPGFPTQDCRLLLDSLKPAPQIDERLSGAIQADFQQYMLAMLPDPSRKFQELVAPIGDDASGDSSKRQQDVYGTYDPIETAQKVGKCVLVEMENAKRPLTNYDKSGDDLVAAEEKGLPKEDSSAKSDGSDKTIDKFKYRLAMNNSHNSIGRLILSYGMVSGHLTIQASCRWRALREATRVLLASRIYRANHRGRLPEAIASFSPILGPWPRDPFNGKAMLYDPTHEVVYSVGTNLIDDGGEISSKTSQAADVGVSLKVGE